jgi:peptidoglycan/LPS O-acetylase OafA/YrhL
MYAAFLLSIAVLQFGRVHLTYGYHQVTLRQVLAHAFLLEVPVPGGLLQNNGVLWSISVESVMYLFFPAIVILTRRIGSISTALACMVVGYGLLFVLRGTIPGGLAWQYLGAFAFGTLAAVVCYSETDSSKSLRDRLPWYSIAVVCVAFVAAIGIGIGWAKADRYTEYFDLPIAIAATAVLIGAARQGRNRIRDALRMRGLVLIGLFSYSLYLIHFPLADLLSVYLVIPLRLGDVGSELMYFGIVVPIIIAAAYFFYLGFEKPFHLLARKMGS